MKSVLLAYICLFMVSGLLADMPGNSPREQVIVQVQLDGLAGYTIYSNGPYASYGEDVQVRDSSEHLLNGGYGAPPCIAFFGVNPNGLHTDSVTICNEEQGRVYLKLSVLNGKLVAEEITRRVKEDIAPVILDNTDNSNNSPGFFRQPLNILILSAFASMLLLAGLYLILQRKKQAL